MLQKQAATSMQTTWKAYSKWEDPRKTNLSVATMDRVARALGARVRIALETVKL